ncbi:BTAD domain-containing putative transcriptional regulator [Micromonospora sp. NPDC047074]|uniref:AfsR/SARP family transcriptional regulator n=1 Tax=Micromonospora sp. NPDC047074 TaxID=3154339 RepID=UPI0033E8AEAB
MRFVLLGTLEVQIAGVPVALGSVKQRLLCAALLLEANEVVSVDRLVDMLWDEPRPASAIANLRTYAHGLRQILRDQPHGPSRLHTRTGGYLLDVRDGELDLHDFERAARHGRDALVAGRADVAESSLERAIGMWRDRPLAPLVLSRALAQRVGRLEEQRVLVEEDYIQVRLDRGVSAELIGRLRELLDEHRFRERSWGQLITALHRTGDVAGAVAAYKSARQALTEHTGLDPAPWLEAIYQEILHRDAKLSGSGPGPAALAAPSQLPPDTHPFVGRDEELAGLAKALEARHGSNIFVVTGAAGVGKTAFAVRWAHRVSSAYPGGCLYLDLRGFDSRGAPPLHPLAALRYLLRSMGVPAAEAPHDVDEASAMLRTLLTERPTLLLLDNAHDAAQVRPLLPGTGSCVTVVTSRRRLAGLVASNGAASVELPLMPAADAVRLLERMLGDRVRHHQSAAHRLAANCAYLPLALRIAAAKLLRDPHLSVADYADELASGDTFAALATSDDENRAVKSAFGVSYRDLPNAVQRLFRLLHLTPGADFDLNAVSALAGVSKAVARRLLEQLCEVYMAVEYQRDRFSMHGLLRHYSLERAQSADTPAMLAQAARRLVDFYTDTLRAAGPLFMKRRHELARRSIHPPPEPLRFPDRDRAFAWHDLERHNFANVVRSAAAYGWHEAAWELADGMLAYCVVRRHWLEFKSAVSIGLKSAEAVGDDDAAASMHNLLGIIAKQSGRFGDALFHYNQGLRLATAIGDGRLVAAFHVNLGGLAITQGDAVTGVENLRQALADPDYSHDPAHATITYLNYGCALIDLDRLDEAYESLTRSLRLAEQAGDDINAGYVQHNLAEICLRRHDPVAARSHAEEELRLAEQAGDVLRRAVALDMLASCRLFDDALVSISLWKEALDTYRTLRHRLQAGLDDWMKRLRLDMPTTEAIRLDARRRRLARRMI